MTTYKLTYFDIDGGRAEPVRIAFHAAGIEFEDERIAFPEFMEMRGGTRFNSLPVLEIDGTVVTQTNGMCRYVGRMAASIPRMTLKPSIATKHSVQLKTCSIASSQPSVLRATN